MVRLTRSHTNLMFFAVAIDFGNKLSFRVFAEALGVGQDYFAYRACETLAARSLPSIREGSWASYILRRSASGCIFSCGPEGDEI